MNCDLASPESLCHWLLCVRILAEHVMFSVPSGLLACSTETSEWEYIAKEQTWYIAAERFHVFPNCYCALLLLLQSFHSKVRLLKWSPKWGSNCSDWFPWRWLFSNAEHNWLHRRWEIRAEWGKTARKFPPPCLSVWCFFFCFTSLWET